MSFCLRRAVIFCSVLLVSFVCNAQTGVEPIRREGNFGNVIPSLRCLERRKNYTEMQARQLTEALVCAEASAECKTPSSSNASKLMTDTGIESTAAAGARTVFTQIYQDCRVLDLDNIICAGGDRSVRQEPLSSKTLKDGTLEVQLEGMIFRKFSNGAVERTVTGPINTEYYNQICKGPEVEKRTPECRLVCSHPTVFNWSAKPDLEIGKNGELSLNLDTVGQAGANKIVIDVDGKKKTVRSSRGHDCTGAIAAFLLADGRLMKPILGGAVALRQEKWIGAGGDQPHHMGSDFLMTAGERTDTCFSTVKMEMDKPLLPGDIISKATHSLMIERLDAGWESDPFGMGCWGQPLDTNGQCASRAMTDEQLDKIDCQAVTPEYFRFDLIQSAGMDNKGYIRNPAYDFFGPSCARKDEIGVCQELGGGADMDGGAALRELAVKYCVARKNKAPAPKALGGVSKRTIGIVRHLAQKPGCMLPSKPKIKNNECVGDCGRITKKS